jgi:hypothetical protein
MPHVPVPENADAGAIPDKGSIAFVNQQLYYSPPALPESEHSDVSSPTAYDDTMPQIDTANGNLFIEHPNDPENLDAGEWSVKKNEQWRFPYCNDQDHVSGDEVRIAYSLTATQKTDESERIAPWIGLKWGSNNEHQMAAPITQEHDFNGTLFGRFTLNWIDVGYTGLKPTLNNASVDEVAAAIQLAFQNAFSGRNDGYKSSNVENRPTVPGYNPFYIRSAQDADGPPIHKLPMVLATYIQGTPVNGANVHTDGVKPRTAIALPALGETTVEVTQDDGMTLTLDGIPDGMTFMTTNELNDHISKKMLFPRQLDSDGSLEPMASYTGAYSVFDMFDFDGFTRSGTTLTASLSPRAAAIAGNPFTQTQDTSKVTFAGPIGGSLDGAVINHGHLVSVADDLARTIRSHARCAQYGSNNPTVSPYEASATKPVKVKRAAAASDPPVSRAADGIAVLPIGVAPDNPAESVSSAVDRSVDAWEYTPPDRAMTLEGADITLDPCYHRTLRGVQAVVTGTGQNNPVADEGTRHILDMSGSDTAETQVRTLGVDNKCCLQILSSAVSSPLLPVYPFQTPMLYGRGAGAVPVGQRAVYGDIMNCVVEALWWTHQWANYEVVNGTREHVAAASSTSGIPSRAYTGNFENQAIDSHRRRLQRLWSLVPAEDRTHWFSPGDEVRPLPSTDAQDADATPAKRAAYANSRTRFFNRAPLAQNETAAAGSRQSEYFDNAEVAYRNTEHMENEYSGFMVIHRASTVWAPMSRTDASCGMLNSIDTGLLIPPCTGKLVPYAVAFVTPGVLTAIRTHSEDIYNGYVPQGRASNAMFASVGPAVFPSDIVTGEHAQCVKLISNWSGIYQSGKSKDINGDLDHDPTLFSSIPPMDSPEALRATLVHAILTEVTVLQCIVQERLTHVFTDGATGDVFACTKKWHEDNVASRYCAWTSPYTADDTVCYAVSPCSFVLSDEDEPPGTMDAHNGACARLFSNDSNDLVTHPATVALASGAPSAVRAELYHPFVVAPQRASFAAAAPDAQSSIGDGHIVFPFEINTESHTYKFYNDMYTHPYPYTWCTETNSSQAEATIPWASGSCFGFLPMLDTVLNQLFASEGQESSVLVALRLGCVPQTVTDQTLELSSTDAGGDALDDGPLIQVTNMDLRRNAATCLFQLRENSQLLSSLGIRSSVTHMIMGTDDGVLLFDQMREDGVSVSTSDCSELTCVSFGVPEGIFVTGTDRFGPPVVITASCPEFVAQARDSWIEQHKVGVFISSFTFLAVVVTFLLARRRRVRRSDGTAVALPQREVSGLLNKR